MISKIENPKQSISYVILSILLYIFIAYFLKRTDFYFILTSFTILFICYYKIIQLQKNNFTFLVSVTLIFRCLFIFSLPNLSQDFYRFIWDGRLILEGMNPYLNLPKDLILNSSFKLPQAQELVIGMGTLSAEHYSNYPPINQLCFLIAGFFSNHSIYGAAIILRLIIILADVGTIYYGRKLLTVLGLESHKIFWYVLNPLVILELSDNLHFEGVMLFFFILSIYLLHKHYLILAGIIFALSIMTKLLPILLLPIFIKYLGFKKSIAFYTVVLATCLLLFLPFLSVQIIKNYSETIGLWFTNFEFNASIYYIIREVGYYFTGYNIIHSVGKLIPVFVVLFIFFKTIFSKNDSILNLFITFLIVLSIYFFTATTVHPWYIINLILISVFTKYKFPVYWSFLVILSYYAYSVIPFKENLYLVFVEYVVVYGIFIYEIKKQKL